jgi:hypothetical protein
MIRRRALICLLALSCFACRPMAQAAEDSPVAPLLFDDAFLLARVNLEKVRVQPLYEVLDNSVGRGLLPSPATVEQFVANLRQAGARQLYVLGDGSVAIVHVPLADLTKAEAIESALLKGPLARPMALEAATALAGGVCAARVTMLAHLRTLKAPAWPHLASALDSTADCTLQILLLPTDGNRHQAAAFPWPILTPAASSSVTVQIAWGSIGIDGPPNGRLKAVFEAKDDSAVAPLAAALDHLFERFLTDPTVTRNVALVERLQEILVWKRDGRRLSLDIDDRHGDLTVVARGMLQPVVQVAQQASGRALALNRLKQIGIALLNHHDVYKSFPAPARLDGEGKPLLSWRVAILPFIDEHVLYKKFHLDEPWDSPHNRPLLAEMPETYRCPLAKIGDDHTVFLTPRGGGSVFAGPEAISIRRIVDGTSKTIATVEVDDEHAVPWTKPDDWDIDLDQPTAGLGGHFGDVFLSGACDGSVRALQMSIDPEMLRCLITCAGREPVAFP